MPFQFQCGAIVRKRYYSDALIFTCFNSSVVRLLGSNSSIINDSRTSFNSSVVRLLEPLLFTAIAIILFQFQCGAIVSMPTVSGYVVQTLFQFQCGAIVSHFEKQK